MSKLGDFIGRLGRMRRNAETYASRSVRLGWAEGKREKERSKPRRIRGGSRKGRMSSPRLTDDFVGPLRGAPTLAEIARTLCYGRAGGERNGRRYPAIPPRDFVKAMADSHSSILKRELLAQLTGSSDRGIEFFAVLAKGQMQRAMRDSNKYAPNAPSTVRAKGSARPLIDTGTLVRSLDFEIR